MKALNLSLAVLTAIGLSACSTSGNSHSQESSKALSQKTPISVDSGTATSNNHNTTENTSAANTQTSNTQSTGTQPTNIPSAANTPSAINTPSATNTSSTPSTPTSGANGNNGSLNGVAYKFNSGSAANKITNPQVITLSSDNKEVLYVEGKAVELAPQGLKPGFTFTNNTDGASLIGGTFVNNADYSPNSQAGIYQDEDTTYVFTQGELTKPSDMPISGTATYTGLSTYHVTNATLNEQVVATETPPKWEIHGAMLTADFGQKTLVGNILTTDAGGRSVVSAEIDAKISGSRFSGEKNGTKNQGAFFGLKANELGGVYVNENKGFAGAFVAKSDWQTP